MVELQPADLRSVVQQLWRTQPSGRQPWLLRQRLLRQWPLLFRLPREFISSRRLQWQRLWRLLRRLQQRVWGLQQWLWRLQRRRTNGGRRGRRHRRQHRRPHRRRGGQRLGALSSRWIAFARSLAETAFPQGFWLLQRSPQQRRDQTPRLQLQDLSGRGARKSISADDLAVVGTDVIAAAHMVLNRRLEPGGGLRIMHDDARLRIEEFRPRIEIERADKRDRAVDHRRFGVQMVSAGELPDVDSARQQKALLLVREARGDGDMIGTFQG